MSIKNLFYCDQFPLWIHYFMRFLCVHNNSSWHNQLGCVPSLHGCGWPFCLGLCFLSLLNCLHHWLFKSLFFLPLNNTFCFSWFSILEHMFFGYFISYGNITSTTFTHVMTICVSAIGWTFVIVIDFPWNILCISTNFG